MIGDPEAPSAILLSRKRSLGDLPSPDNVSRLATSLLPNGGSAQPRFEGSHGLLG